MSQLQRMKWVTSYRQVVPNWVGVLRPTSIFLANAPELRRIIGVRRMA